MDSVVIADPIFGSSFLTELTNQLELPEDAADSLFSQKTFVTHMYPPDCGNISSAMKSIVNGFVERETTLGKGTFYCIFAVELLTNQRSEA